MFGIGKKKELKDDKELYNPVSGEVIELSKVNDPVFSKKIMGDGFAVEPKENKIFAPVSAKVTLVQGHAIGFKRADGLDILLHLGIDTVALKGAPLKLKLKWMILLMVVMSWELLIGGRLKLLVWIRQQWLFLQILKTFYLALRLNMVQPMHVMN